VTVCWYSVHVSRNLTSVWLSEVMYRSDRRMQDILQLTRFVDLVSVRFLLISSGVVDGESEGLSKFSSKNAKFGAANPHFGKI